MSTSERRAPITTQTAIIAALFSLNAYFAKREFDHITVTLEQITMNQTINEGKLASMEIRLQYAQNTLASISQTSAIQGARRP